jgi:hypothetical protein
VDLDRVGHRAAPLDRHSAGTGLIDGEVHSVRHLEHEAQDPLVVLVAARGVPGVLERLVVRAREQIGVPALDVQPDGVRERDRQALVRVLVDLRPDDRVARAVAVAVPGAADQRSRVVRIGPGAAHRGVSREVDLRTERVGRMGQVHRAAGRVPLVEGVIGAGRTLPPSAAVAGPDPLGDVGRPGDVLERD